MKTYLIDGNNVLRSNTDMKKLFEEDSERAKDLLIQKVVDHFKDSNNKITIFFDGFSFVHSFSNVSHNVSVKHAKNKTADDTILITIEKSKNTRNIIVVTSDLEVQKKAKVRLCEVMSSDEFIKKLSTRRVSSGEKPDKPTTREIEEWTRIFQNFENNSDD